MAVEWLAEGKQDACEEPRSIGGDDPADPGAGGPRYSSGLLACPEAEE
jgi:hypothetical protein